MRPFSALSLTYKLTLITLGVGLVGVIVVAIFAQQATQREFSRFIVNQARREFVRIVEEYYQRNGSWDGLLEALPRPERPAPNPPPFGAPNPPPTNVPRPNDATAAPASFILVDSAGCIVTPAPPYNPGDCLAAERLSSGAPVFVRGNRVGTVLTVNPIPNLGGIERAFLNAMTSALRNAALVATGLALILGLILARMVTRPLKALTTAIHAMSHSNLKQEVAVTTQDEFGEVATAFNQMSEKLSKANHLRQQMTADIAHELRNPLVVITGYIESMRDGVLDATPERLALLYEEGQHLQHLVDDLWTLARADAGELPLTRRTVALSELLERTATAYNDRARRQKIALVVEKNATPTEISVDSERIAQVLGNLVGNALRYTPEGGAIRLGAETNGKSARLFVRDDGIGIAQDKLPFIFERFYRADDAREGNDGESGLGLAIAKSIVVAHGGDITATSSENNGTTMTITLPIGAVSQQHDPDRHTGDTDHERQKTSSV